MDDYNEIRLSPLRRGLAIDSTVDIFNFYVPHRHVYGEQWIMFMKDGVNATPLSIFYITDKIAYEIQVCMKFSRVIFFFQAEDGIRDSSVTGVQTCALPI